MPSGSACYIWATGKSDGGGEGVCASRKVIVIMLAAFAHDDSLQLHFTSGVMIVAFALHSIFLPFDTSSEKINGDEPEKRKVNDWGGAESELDICYRRCCCCSRRVKSQREWLFIEWNGTVFLFYVLCCGLQSCSFYNPGCVSPQCKFFGPLCVALVVASNILFLWMGSRTFLKFYVKNMEEKLAKKEAKRRATGEVTFRKFDKTWV